LKTSALFVLSGFCLFLAGCGGSGSQGPGQTTPQTTKVGDASVTYIGKAKPLVEAALGGVTVVGLAGASFTNLTLNPTKTLSNTSIAYTDSDVTGPQAVPKTFWTVVNGLPTDIAGAQIINPNSVTYSNSGLMAFIAWDTSLGSYQIFWSNYDGSGVHEIKPALSVSVNAGLSWSPTATKIAYTTLGNDIDVVNFNASITSGNNTISNTKVASNAMYPAFSPDGSQIAITDISATPSAIEVIPATGGGATTVSNSFGDIAQQPSWSPDGKLIAYTDIPNTKVSFIGIVDSTGAGNYLNTINAPTGSVYASPVFAPDGNSLVVSQSFVGATSGTLMNIGLSGQSPYIVAQASDGFMPTFTSWSPFYAPRQFIGASGIAQFPSAAGFILGQSATTFSSLVTFTATTPSTAKVTQLSTGGSTVVFDIHADAITGIKFTNGYYSQVQSITPGGTDALVSIDSNSGRVLLVAPYIASNGGVKFSQGTAKSFKLTGQFTSAWNGKGQNLAANGASQISVTGQTIVAQ